MPGEKGKASGSCPEPMSLELALQKAKQHQVETVTMISETQEEDEEETITWERTPSEISTLQKEDGRYAISGDKPHSQRAGDTVRTRGPSLLV